MVFRFGPFVLDSAAFTLARGDAPVPLSPKALDLLAYLLARPTALVTKDELFHAIWPDTFVTDNALTQAISELRRALGDRPSSPTYIQTVARRGYRFLAPVEASPDAPGQVATATAHPHRETSNLDAYRAFVEGRLKLESLDTAEIPAAVDSFKRAIALDPGFAAAYVGLANAHFWLYEATRYRADADTRLLAQAIEEATCAVQIDEQFAEAHATLGYLLVGAGDYESGRKAVARALALQPNHWPHFFRLGHASWGAARLDALKRCLDLYPDFPFAYFQMAMVHIARSQLTQAEQSLRQGIALQERHARSRGRFPANGLHWLLGLIQLARGDADGALAELAREGESGSNQLYSAEFAQAAAGARGFALLQRSETDAAEAAFRRALEGDAPQARPRLGLALTLGRLQRQAEAEMERRRALDEIASLRQAGRTTDAALLTAGERALAGHCDEALAMLTGLLTEAAPGHAGWQIPIEPLFEPLRALPGYALLRARLAARAV